MAFPGVPAPRAELGLARADRGLRRRPAGRPPGVLRQGRPLQPEARRGRRGRRAAGRLAARRAAGDGHQQRATRAVRPSSTAGATAPCGWSPSPPTTTTSPGSRRPNWVNVAINVLSTLLFLAVLYAAFRSRRGRGPAHRGRREAAARAAGPARRAGLARLLRAAPRQERASGRRPARRPSPTGSSAGCRWPPATRSATPRPGPARSSRGSPRPASTPGCPAVMGASEEAGHGLRPARPGRAGARRRGHRRDRPSSPWRAAPCGRSGRRTTGSGGPGTPCASAGTRTSRPTRWRDLRASAPTHWRDGETERGFSHGARPARATRPTGAA